MASQKPFEERRHTVEGLMHIHGSTIYTLAMRLTGDAVVGEHLAIDTFVVAFKKLSELRDDFPASSWLSKICIDLEKKRVGGQRQTIELSESLNRQDAVKCALVQLDVEERALIILRDMDDKSYEVIAEILEIPLETVRVRISLERNRLRQILVPVIDKVL